MPKLRHEAVVEILQNEPRLVLWLLTHSGAPLRLGARLTATIADSNLTDREPNEDGQQVRGLFSDNVFVFEDDSRRIAVVAEVQTDHPDSERALSWPAYIANARRQHRCDTLLMIFAITQDAARGSAKPIRTGHPGWDLVPLISGFGKIPGLPADGAQFGAELVLLRIITCELTLDTHDARMFALAAIRSAPAERVTRYTKYLKALVPPSIRKDLETLMKIELKDAFIDGWIEEGLTKGLEKGLAKGREQGLEQGLAQGLGQARVEMLLELLETRFSLSAEIRKQVEECTAETQVKTWFKRAIGASSLDEVFAELRTHISCDDRFGPG